VYPHKRFHHEFPMKQPTRARAAFSILCVFSRSVLGRVTLEWSDFLRNVQRAKPVAFAPVRYYLSASSLSNILHFLVMARSSFPGADSASLKAPIVNGTKNISPMPGVRRSIGKFFGKAFRSQEEDEEERLSFPPEDE